MNVFDHPEFDHHELVVFCDDRASGLRGIIAVHNTNLGPGAGGLRMWNYASFDDALTDVLRLSKGMSYKSALAGLPCGGGKSVIIADPHIQGIERERILRAFARHVQTLNGKYRAAEDVGISVDDVAIMMQECDYMFGLPDGTGDPSPLTARGTYEGIRAAVRHQHQRDDLRGVRVAVQGVGHVGYYLAELLADAGAELVITDINAQAIDRVVQDFGATYVEPDAIYAADVDVYAPCALGATLNDRTIPQLQAQIVAGAANNQLAEARHGQMLHERGILYAPDYVINAGGIINASGDIVGDYNYDETLKRVIDIHDTLLKIFTESQRMDRPTHEIADDLAQQRLQRDAFAATV